MTTIPGEMKWYTDHMAVEKGEPGIYHSYMASIATVFNYLHGGLDPVWLMGTSGFAFRIFINETFCPSAMSVFDFSAILPEVIEQMGHRCQYVCRYWNEEKQEREKREQAHDMICRWLDKKVPAIVWDIAGCEWGIITGYDVGNRFYTTLTWEGIRSFLPLVNLGKNGIDILSVAIPAEPNKRNPDEIILNSLKTAVNHAEQKESTKEPGYASGLPAYDLWAKCFERWAMLLESGKGDKLPGDLQDHAKYYAGHYYSARCYAREYLNVIADGDERLEKAANHYAATAACLKPPWDFFSKETKPEPRDLTSFAQRVKEAKAAEQEGVNCIKEFLVQSG